MVNIVIPMAGLGSRFSRSGFELPKPFIDVAGKPMIERVLDNLNVPGGKFILLARKEHIDEYDLHVTNIKSTYNVEFFPVDRVTQGTACTVLLARHVLGDDVPLVIANSDQIIDINFSDFLEDAQQRNLSGSILTFWDEFRDPKWSFAKLGDDDLVEVVREKEPISNHATVGIYYFKKASDFVDGAIDMILNQESVNDEYYTCPVYNYLIRRRLAVGIYQMEADLMHGVGTPEDLDLYLRSRYPTENRRP